MQKLLSKDLEARETLALLDPLAQEALEVNGEARKTQSSTLYSIHKCSNKLH